MRADLQAAARDFLAKYPAVHCFETPSLHELDKMLAPFGFKTCFQAEYFLPDLNALRARPGSLELSVLQPADFAGLYLPQWSNALCAERRQNDALCVGAYDKGTLAALAGASADCANMWQIGVDVLPAYRRQGLAKAVTSRLALEILSRGKVPFYCAAWSNIPSVRNALACGFRPAWVQLTAKPLAFVEKLQNTGK